MNALEHINGVGPKTKENLIKNNIESVEDLVFRTPKRYENYSIQKVTYLDHLSTVVVSLIMDSEVKAFTKNGLTYSRFYVKDGDNNRYEAIVFNQGYLSYVLKPHDKIVAKVKLNFYQKKMVIQHITKESQHEEIKPIYDIKGITSGKIRQILKDVFSHKTVDIPEMLPQRIRSKYQFMSRYNAFVSLHFPEHENDLKQALYQMKYEEAYHMLNTFYQQSRVVKQPINYDIEQVKKDIKAIPFELTKDQKEATNAIFKDLKAHVVVNRLIQGDVGSGKTVVALIAMMGVASAHKQVVLLAPTELLARQHYQNFYKVFPHITSVLLTSSSSDKMEIKKKIKEQHISVIIGTHALFEDDVMIPGLALIIVDEQHKFGVFNRKTLLDKKREANVVYLTATPIPRTLAIATMGFVEISRILTKPKARKPIKTRVIKGKDLTRMWEDFKSAHDRGEHSYIVSSAIDSTHIDLPLLQLEAVVRKKLPNIPIFVLHGKQKEDVQTQMLNGFYQTKGSVLLSTTMIEVGIDLSTATRMAIFEAERFGLSQLHQLRGRIGRSSLESVCYLVTEKKAVEKLEIMEKVEDGFILSNYDMKFRGFGDLLGSKQSGIPRFKFLDMATDETLFGQVKEDIQNMNEYDIIKK